MSALIVFINYIDYCIGFLNLVVL